MKNLPQARTLFFRTLIIGAGLLCAVGVAAWTGPTQSPPAGNVGNFWSPSGSNISYTAGNVGIGTANPASTLDVAGTINATTLNSTKAAHVQLVLTGCGGACPGNLGAGTWYAVGANRNHTVVVNNDSSTFTTSTNGLVTVNKTGTYLITIYNMILNPGAGYGDFACPTINGTLTCYGNAAAEANYTYQYSGGGWEGAPHQFTADITAGTSVGYSIYTYQATSYWGIDGYTGMEIVKLN